MLKLTGFATAFCLLMIFPVLAQEPGEGKSAEEIALELANPNTALASPNFKFQFRGIKEVFTEAGDQNGAMLLFQPTLPFPLKNGATIFFRPAIPLLFSHPTFNLADMDFDNEFGLGDTTFDVAYGRTSPTGLLLAAGMVATVPTATKSSLGNDRWTAGPEFLIGKMDRNYVLGMFPSHQWDFGGSGDADVSLTNVQVFGLYLPGGGWTVGTAPSMAYDHISHEWTIPVNFTFGKTIIRGGRPWKLSMELNYYFERPDSFSQEWMIGINIGPVVQNKLADWFR